jgi:hypothetical protein
MGVEEGQLLIAMGGIVGGVEINGDVFHPSRAEPAAMPLDHRLGQRLAHPVKVTGIDRVLEARERGLRGERFTLDRLPVAEQLVHRIVGEARGVVAVGVAAGDGEHPLTEEVLNPVADLARLAVVRDAGGEAFTQAETGVGGFEQNRAAVAAAVGLVESGHERHVEKIAKQDRLSCGIVVHAKAPFVDKALLARPFYHIWGFCFWRFVNYPG